MATLAVVHNGVIENFQAAEDALQSEGYVFRSATDTEVIAHLIASCLKRQPPVADMAAVDYRAADCGRPSRPWPNFKEPTAWRSSFAIGPT